ncbi:MAG: glycosyltransferase [Anaerolineae bacterium]|nr:glycosyltransferase [Anaerolineae bacterium]
MTTIFLFVTAVLVTGILIGITAIAIISALTFPRLGQSSGTNHQPRVSILVPARNEANVINGTVRRLLAQTYPHFDILLLDDNSTDDTAVIARAAAGDDPRLIVLNGDPLPTGWLGKNWACHQLAQAAQGDLLIFTDADVIWSPDALTGLVAKMEQSGANLLTVWPTQITVTWGERLVVPLMALVILGYLPLPLVNKTRWASFAAANGQLLAFRHEAYNAVGGHQAVRNETVEDIVLARRVKQRGLRLWMADGAGVISCRMYQNWPEVRDGYAKNIIAGYGNSVFRLAAATVFHWLIFLAPWLWLVFGWLGEFPGWPLWPLVLIGLGVGVRMLTAAATRQRLGDALLLPVSVLLMTRIAGQAVWWRWHGGPRWKGRTIGQGEDVVRG